MAKSLMLILGGVRSGKSTLAQRKGEELGGKVLFVATGEALDEEMAWRIQEHRRKRPKSWRTLEVSMNVGRKLGEQAGDSDVVILDCVTLLVSNITMHLAGLTVESIAPRVTANRVRNVEQTEAARAEKLVMSEMQELITFIAEYGGTFIVISNEVGLGLVPDNPLGRLYRDLLGKANQVLAHHAQEVYFMAAGIPVKIKG